jgi:undecaprenol kinase
MRRFAERIGYALNGLRLLIISDRHFQIHTIAFFLVVILGFFFEINSIEWVGILLISVLVFVTEAINSSIEKLSDAITMEKNPLIKQVKDIAAGAVLVAAVVAIIIGIIIFSPYFYGLIH